MSNDQKRSAKDALRSILIEAHVNECDANAIAEAYREWRIQRQQWVKLQRDIEERERLAGSRAAWAERRKRELNQSIAHRTAIVAGHNPHEPGDDALKRMVADRTGDDMIAQIAVQKFRDWRRQNYSTQRRRALQ